MHRHKKKKNDAQLIKALIYRAQLRDIKEEDPNKSTIAEMEAEIGKAAEPARAILENITASLYWSYFQQNRWKLYDRSTTVNFNQTDIATWSSANLHKKISDLYLASLKNEKLLRQTKLEPFDAIIEKGNTRHLRPTLFDLLANHALTYFKTDERNINKPADAFEIDDAAAFADARTFANHRFVTTDSLSLHAKALQLYQRLIQFHLTDAQPDALIDIDIDRLAFANSYAVVDNKKDCTAKHWNSLLPPTATGPLRHRPGIYWPILMWKKPDPTMH
ncbi:hypothetical protein [Paraflavitalea speifideaquila]|uniref:hypothetical protein n=1 Tax=Paraflavitalea speifideaquila TaxID=3076558 RepID=UPI0028EEC5C0|nr:hypothetical protein [Paraflavitalea speifideiaquila]